MPQARRAIAEGALDSRIRDTILNDIAAAETADRALRVRFALQLAAASALAALALGAGWQASEIAAGQALPTRRVMLWAAAFAMAAVPLCVPALAHASVFALGLLVLCGEAFVDSSGERPITGYTIALTVLFYVVCVVKRDGLRIVRKCPKRRGV